MIAEAIAKILSLAPPTTYTIDGKTYSNRELYEVREAQERQPIQLPVPDDIDVTTLKGFADLISEKIEEFDPEKYVVQVVDEKKVRLVSRLSDACGRRQTLITATPVKFQEFSFGKWLDQETFIIAVNALFSQTDDKDYVLRIASSVTSEAANVSEDDGISQKVTVKAGMKVASVETVKKTVNLAPFRTFPECNQPISEFVFRARPGENGGTFMLFEADGGKWRIDAINEVRRYLSVLNQLDALTIVA